MYYKDINFCTSVECQNYDCLRNLKHAEDLPPWMEVVQSNFYTTCSEYLPSQQTQAIVNKLKKGRKK